MPSSFKALTHMLEIIIFFLIAVTYFTYMKQHGMEIICLAALLFSALYIWIYLAVPPHVPIKSGYSGQLFGLLPLVALSLILFPEFTNKIPASLTRVFGWCMLLGIGALLIVFKMFVW